MIKKDKYTYLLRIQYLGFRFHGWAKQPKLKTIHQMLDKTFDFVLGSGEFKSLGSSRTDAMVSANESLVQLISYKKLDDDFLDTLNRNLPSDIKALEIKDFPKDFNIIQSPKLKEYLYLFSFGEKPHPFSSSFLVNIPDYLDIIKMKQGAAIFEGKHNFLSYCTKPSKETNPNREIEKCEIIANSFFQGSFFPTESFALRIRSKGFMRNQVRLMMAQLFNLGLGKIDLDEIQKSLEFPEEGSIKSIAPPSGLILNQIILDS